MQSLGSVQTSQADQSSSKPGAAEIKKKQKNKTEVRQVKIHKEDKLAKIQSKKTEVK